MCPASSPVEQVLTTYFRAKDGNRPHLLERVFAADARLEVRDRSTASMAMGFPAFTVGREAIAEVMVSQFGQSYENVYSFYLDRPRPGVREFTCQWLVGMTEKAGKAMRVGCGRYDWRVQSGPDPLAESLVISIESMQVLPASMQSPLLVWLEGLPYPWATRSVVIGSAPAVKGLGPVLACLAKHS